MLIFYGLRRGEVLGLEWKDFDFSNKTMSILRTSKYSKSIGIYTDSTKTEESTRILAISDDTISFLNRYKLEQDKMKAIYGNCWIDNDRLFVSEGGSPLHPNVPYNWLKRFCNSNGITFKGLHSFRHAMATTAITNGADIKTVSAVLGHSQTSTTLNIYSHAVKQANARAINIVADIINGKGTN